MRTARFGWFPIALLLTSAASQALAQSPFGRPKPGDEPPAPAPAAEEPPDPLKGLAFRKTYDKALEYVLAEYEQASGIIPTIFAGFVFKLDGREEMQPHLDRAVQIALRQYKNEEAFNANWFTAYCGLLLACVYLDDRREDIKAALEDLIQVAERNVESTGGWGHHKGMAEKTGYNKRGGSTDLSIVTATMFSTFLIMKEAGIEVPEALLDRTHKHLESVSSGGGGFAYGSSNRTGDRALSRGAMAYIGIHAARFASPVVGALPQALGGASRSCESGHAYGPVHFFADAAALSLMGRYADMANYWLPKLASSQAADGSVAMKNDGTRDGEAEFTKGTRLGSTAAFAMMILLQNRPFLERPDEKRQRLENAEKKAAPSGPSPFGNRK